jgi:hypothetical protein
MAARHILISISHTPIDTCPFVPESPVPESPLLYQKVLFCTRKSSFPTDTFLIRKGHAPHTQPRLLLVDLYIDYIDIIRL